MRTLLAGLAGIAVLATLAPMAVIAFSSPKSPPPMPAMAESMKQVRLNDLPPPRSFQARDGATLQYYAYPAGMDKVAVLIHGSVGPGTTMHALAETLRGAGVTTYVPDIRGHGGSGPHGDIGYIGQLDDDLADFIAQLGPARSGESRTLVGFSAGAGFVIRFAGGPYGLLFDRYVFLSPILPGGSTLRPNAGGWTDIALPRIITIAQLGRLGMHWFDGLPVIRYAVPAEDSQGTPGYSYRLATNFGAGRQYETYLRNLRRQAAILVGSADEQVVADQFAPLLHRLDVDVPVTIVPDMTHGDMIASPAAIQSTVRAITQP
jgi:pimeloyl-ACP methyl ester carboxylesterase